MNKDPIKIEGFSRVQIEQDGKIVGDSGFVGPNQITNVGFLNYLCHLLGGSAGSRQVLFVALGTGGAPATDATALPGEITSSTQRNAPVYANVGSTTAQFTVTFASSESFLAAQSTLDNIGLFCSSAENSLFAGNIYTASTCDTNQAVNCTYQIRFT
jgi:hypothetical protein